MTGARSGAVSVFNKDAASASLKERRSRRCSRIWRGALNGGVLNGGVLNGGVLNGGMPNGGVFNGGEFI
jgi:hypothetical protein